MIAIVDADNKMANIPLMKISSYYNKAVKWFVPGMNPEKIYISKIFTGSADYNYKAGEVIAGGTGIDPGIKLPEQIEAQQPDYSIYSNCNYSVQLYSRGCVNKCPFCVVPEKEGGIRPIKPMNLNPLGEYIEIFDNNFFANPEWREAVKDLIERKQPVNFHGIDARILTEEQAFSLNKLQHRKYIHIAWDSPKYNMVPKLEKILKWIKPYKLMCYVLIGYWSTEEEDIYRIEKLRELNISPYVMPYNKNDDYQAAFARYVNKKQIFKSIKWKEYKRFNK